MAKAQGEKAAGWGPHRSTVQSGGCEQSGGWCSSQGVSPASPCRGGAVQPAQGGVLVGRETWEPPLGGSILRLVPQLRGQELVLLLSDQGQPLARLLQLPLLAQHLLLGSDDLGEGGQMRGEGGPSGPPARGPCSPPTPGPYPRRPEGASPARSPPPSSPSPPPSRSHGPGRRLPSGRPSPDCPTLSSRRSQQPGWGGEPGQKRPSKCDTRGRVWQPGAGPMVAGAHKPSQPFPRSRSLSQSCSAAANTFDTTQKSQGREAQEAAPGAKPSPAPQWIRPLWVTRMAAALGAQVTQGCPWAEDMPSNSPHPSPSSWWWTWAAHSELQLGPGMPL